MTLEAAAAATYPTAGVLYNGEHAVLIRLGRGKNNALPFCLQKATVPGCLPISRESNLATGCLPISRSLIWQQAAYLSAGGLLWQQA